MACCHRYLSPSWPQHQPQPSALQFTVTRLTECRSRVVGFLIIAPHSKFPAFCKFPTFLSGTYPFCCLCSSFFFVLLSNHFFSFLNCLMPAIGSTVCTDLTDSCKLGCKVLLKGDFRWVVDIRLEPRTVCRGSNTMNN